MNKIITFLATAFVLLSCSSVPKQGPTTRFTGVFPDGPIPDSVEIQYWIPTDTVLLVKTKMVPVVDRRFEGEIPSCVTQFAEVFVPGDIVKFIAGVFKAVTMPGIRSGLTLSMRRSVKIMR